jgi:hypothetical protein
MGVNPTARTDGQALLDPRGDVTVDAQPIADRLETLEGATIGFLDNAKTNADHFLEDVAGVLTAEYGVAETIHRGKANTAVPADSIASYLASNCDAVVNAYGDCGSCTSWCVYDSVDLEKQGVPTATVNSDEFVRLGQSESRSLGMPGLPLVTVPHPMGDIERETVRERAENATPALVRVLTTPRDELESEYEGKYLEADEELADEELYCPI